MKRVEIFISYCGADQPLKDEVASALGTVIEEYEGELEIELVAMDTHCAGNWAEWMIEAVKSCEIFIPLLTRNSMHTADGETRKRMFEEARIARNSNKEMVPFASCSIPDEMEAHVGTYSAVGTVRGVTEKTRILLEGIVTGKRNAFRMGASLAGFTSAESNRNFVGRKKEIKWLEEHLDKRNVVILTGAGGIGKTTLAECFFQAKRDKYSSAYIVNAQNGVRRSIIDLPFETQYIKDENERYAENKRLLSALDEKTIIILDNCDITIDGSEIDDILDKLRCRFIVTSRVGDDGRCAVDTLAVGRMDDDELLALVRTHNPSVYEQNDGTKDEIDKRLCKLFRTVDGHTMTVEMASAIMENAWVSLEEITKTLLECEETALTRKFDSEQTIMANLRALYDFARLGETEKKILNVLCLISPAVGIDFVALKKLLELKTANEARWLVKNTFARRDTEKGGLSMHPLFADVYYQTEGVGKSEEYQKTAEYIAQLKPDEADLKKNEQAMLTCLYFVEKRAKELENKALIGNMYSTIGSCFGMIAEHTKELEYKKKALVICIEMYKDNPNHPKIALSYNNIGVTYSKLGDYQKALEYHEKALAIRLEIYRDTPNHPCIAASYNNIGGTYDDLGEHQKALEYQEKALAILLEVYKDTPNHPYIAMSYNNIGFTYGNLGEHQKALEYKEKALAIRLEVYKDMPNHPRIASSYNNIGVTYGKLGEHQKALEYYEKALAIRLEAYKDTPNHPDIASSYNNTGYTYGRLGEHQMALECREKALAILLEVHKNVPNHPNIIRTYNRIANLYEVLGNEEMARKYREKAKRLEEHE